MARKASELQTTASVATLWYNRGKMQSEEERWRKIRS